LTAVGYATHQLIALLESELVIHGLQLAKLDATGR